MTPEKSLEVGDEVVVIGHTAAGTRKIASLYNQREIPGGVKLDKPVGLFVSWNEDTLLLVKKGRAMNAKELQAYLPQDHPDVAAVAAAVDVILRREDNKFAFDVRLHGPLWWLAGTVRGDGRCHWVAWVWRDGRWQEPTREDVDLGMPFEWHPLCG